MSEDYEKVKMNYADGYIPNNPNGTQNTKKKTTTKQSGTGFFVTIIIALFIIAIGILANVILQLKAEEKLRSEQLDIITKQLEAYKEVIRDIDYKDMFADEEETQSANIIGEVNTIFEGSDNIINTNSVSENTTNE
jgi:hypothetical protein